MNQGDLIEKVASAASISKAEAERAINAVKEAITDSLRKNTKVTLVGFGTFAVSHRRARRESFHSGAFRRPHWCR